MSSQPHQRVSPPFEPPSPGSVRRRRLAIVGLALLASPLAAEAALRVTGSPGLVRHVESGRKHRPVDGPMGHRPKPNHSVEVRYLARDGSVLRTAVMTANARSMRGPLPRGGRPRIVCIGDSHTYGYGVNDGEPWPRVLERGLQAGGAPRAEVLNLAAGGYGPRQELERLRVDGLPLGPDVVLWQWFMNDVGMDDGGLDRSRLRRATFRCTAPSPEASLEPLRRVSRLADLLCARLHTWARGDDDIIQGIAARLPGSAEWAAARRRILEGRRLAESAGARFAVVLHPLMVRRGECFASTPIDDRVREFCTRESIELIDLAQALDPREASRLRNSDLDYHSSAYCHALVGAAVASALDRLDWCRPGPRTR